MERFPTTLPTTITKVKWLKDISNHFIHKAVLYVICLSALLITSIRPTTKARYDLVVIIKFQFKQ